MCQMNPSDTVREAIFEWENGNIEIAIYLLKIARESLSMARICQLLGVELTMAIYGLVIEISNGKSVKFVERTNA